jgi:hypothetical protein
LTAQQARTATNSSIPILPGQSRLKRPGFRRGSGYWVTSSVVGVL